MIPSDHPRHDNSRDIGIVPLSDQVLVRFQFQNAMT
jgi:hypothetical protein